MSKISIRNGECCEIAVVSNQEVILTKCKNNGKLCACSIYAGDIGLPLLYSANNKK